MPIWSLTKERVEKLLAQIRDIEVEIDALIKLTREDLWSKDLDEFINEWRAQLQEEASMRKKMAAMGRRASSKLNINAKVPRRQRKAQGEDPDDSDFETKAVARKAAPVKRSQPKSTLLSPSAPLAKPTVTKKPTTTAKAKTVGAKSSSNTLEDKMPPQRTLDAVSSFESAPTSDLPVASIFQKAKAAAVSKKTAPAQKATPEDGDDDDVDEELIRPVASRKPREAAKKVPTYNLDDSDSNGDDMLLDVGKMVKGIGNAPSDQATTTRPLFSTSMSRPGSSAGLPKKSSSLVRQPTEIDGDDTDYSKLAPPPAAKRALSITGRRTVISDDDDDDDDDDDILPVSKKPAPPKATTTSKASKTVAAKPAAKAKAKESVTASSKPSSSKQSVSQPPKKMPLSPAAKAYAAKHAKNKPLPLDADSDDEVVEDEVDKAANAILDDDDDNDDGKDELEDEADDDEPVVRRPARRAAAQAAAKVTKGWDDESEEEGEDEDNETFDDDDEDSE